MLKLSCALLLIALSYVCSKYNYEVKYFETYVDHFTFSNTSKKFPMRYLISNKYWKGRCILFYTGNEGDITLFAENTGFIWDHAKSLGALVVFAEHRYYGKSLPFGNKSFSTVHNRAYLTAEQTLADFANLIQYLKVNISGAKNAPVISVGGSYGGMLTAYFRMKYPNLISGGIAASAPILMVGNTELCKKPYQILTRAYALSNNNSTVCPTNIQRMWTIIEKMSQSAQGRTTLTKIFHTCSTVESGAQNLISTLEDLLFTLGMANYPYKTNFVAPLPAWPVKVFCKPLMNKTFKHPIDLLVAAAKGFQIFNVTGVKKCLPITSNIGDGLDGTLWDYQTCTEFPMPMCSDGVTSMFQRATYSIADKDKTCRMTYNGVSPRWGWARTVFWGDHLRAASNIVFTNGQLDPWAGGGLLNSSPGRKYLQTSIRVWEIPRSAHHLDLRAANPNDPPEVRLIRQMEIAEINRWINSWKVL